LQQYPGQFRATIAAFQAEFGYTFNASDDYLALGMHGLFWTLAALVSVLFYTRRKH
jgi:hypothetical protein